MKFTAEIESNNMLHFVGLTITHNVQSNNNFSFSILVYRKPTSTSLYTNFNSFTPLAYRLSVFRSLIHRALRLCSSWQSIHTEIQCVRSMLLRNSYPSRILDRIIKSLIDSFVNPRVMYGPAKDRLSVHWSTLPR